jgi:hypothetical protein
MSTGNSLKVSKGAQSRDLAMAEATPQPKVQDPHAVPEVVCDGPMNVHWIGNRATITFTHPRARSEPLFEGKEAPMDLVVRARVATTIENLVGLRDLLIHLFPVDRPASEIPTGGGATGKLH